MCKCLNSWTLECYHLRKKSWKIYTPCTALSPLGPMSLVGSCSNVSSLDLTFRVALFLNQRYQSGTSMSAPIVAGAAALYLQVNPSANPQDVMDAVIENALEGAMSNLQHESPNILISIAELIKGVQFDPEEPVLVYEEDVVQEVSFDISLSFTPESVVWVTLAISNGLFGVISPMTIAYGPGNWSVPTQISFIPRTTVFPVGRVMMIEATLESSNGDALTRGLRLIDTSYSRPGDKIDNPIHIASVPYHGTIQSAMYSDNIHTECTSSAAIEWGSPDVFLAFTPSKSGTITIDLCSSHVPTKLIVLNSTHADEENRIVCKYGMTDCGFRSQMSTASLNIESGMKYIIVADGFNGSTGLIAVHISEGNGGTILSKSQFSVSPIPSGDSTPEPVVKPGSRGQHRHPKEKNNHGVSRLF